MRTIVHLCTVELVQLMQEVDLMETCPVDIEGKDADIEGAIEDIVELNYLDPMYGNKGKLRYDAWVDASETTKSVAKIWYDPQNIRMLAFHRAGIDAGKKDTDDFASVCKSCQVNLKNHYPGESTIEFEDGL